MTVLKWIVFAVCALILIKNLRKTFRIYNQSLEIYNAHKLFQTYFPNVEKMRHSINGQDPYEVALDVLVQLKDCPKENEFGDYFRKTVCCLEDEDVVPLIVEFGLASETTTYVFFPEKPYKNYTILGERFTW